MVIWLIFCIFAVAMRNLPPITKKLLLANLIVWLLDSMLEERGIYLTQWLGLWNINTGLFYFWQPITYMFMHANFGHLFCNMFAVLMFGPALEESWGQKKFLLYYAICGLGAAAVQLLVWHLTGSGGVTIGASGAVFGILFAFGWLFPDVPMFFLFIPIPIRARTFVFIYAAVELMAGLADFSFDNVAHFAHLGGMLFGWLLLLFWRHNPFNRFPRIRRDETDEKKGKDFSDYHYQEPIR